MNWKIILIGLTLIGLSAIVSAAYNPYANYFTNGPFGYSRPFYTQFHAVPNTPSFVGSYGFYGGYRGYRSYPVTYSFPVPNIGICNYSTGCFYR